ncbi:MAG: tRNA (adenosine(37)-N6)-threonylcarbamoyltransferase complex dimerization subunit type 1 TsaB [Gammaproteobacteria bacterium]|nr:tRNA (adenosine(37)-N6)-threonylcarbamoyltransferase complex dimerization subunit type 1 TsaB [Gammaproteobacteria bacterium]
MKLLAIDTATEACSAALLIEGNVQSEYQIAPQQHADLILPMVEKLLAEAAIKLNQLDAIAFGRGPGSFTGVRIATSVTQGLAYGADIPVVPVSTLATMAQRIYREQQKSKVLAVIDARISEVYWAVYQLDKNNLMQLQGEESVIAPENVPLPEGDDWYGVGTGWGSYRAQLENRLGNRITGSQSKYFPHAMDMIPQAVFSFEQGLAVPAEQALPVYLRDKVAVKKA